MFWHKLYVRIWLAVVLAVVVLTMVMGWVWRASSEPPLREVVVRNMQGEIIGSARRHTRPPGPAHPEMDGPPQPPHHRAATAANPSDPTNLSNDADPADSDDAPTPGRFGRGPEFVVQLEDGQTLMLHLPRPPKSRLVAPFGFAWTLALVAVAVALGTYPIVRRLTRRLEALQHGVERWGNGELSARVPIQGNDEVGFLATRFNHAAQRIENLLMSRDRLLAAQKSLLANASHELRSPLARIRMGIELMGHTPNASTRSEIARNINELDQLVEEILLASRLDAQEADIGAVESVDLVGLAAEECAHNHASLDVEQAELLVPGVAKLLRRAVRNLLENAHRYGGNGAVTVILRSTPTQAVIQVCDQGRGIAPDQQTRIFEPFYRLPGASERDGGVGLGLALVQSIAQRHAGSVCCYNLPEGGACFEIRLPLQHQTSSAATD